MSRIEGHKRVLAESKGLVDLGCGDLRWGAAAENASCDLVRPVEGRDERIVAVVVRHGAQR